MSDALAILGAAVVDIAPPRGACPACYEAAWVWTTTGRKVCARCLGLPPSFGEYCRPRPIPEAVAREVKRIEGIAMGAGWTQRELWQNAGWHHVRGLAGIMQAGTTVEKVGYDAITLRLQDGRRLRFYRRGELN